MNNSGAAPRDLTERAGSIYAGRQLNSKRAHMYSGSPPLSFRNGAAGVRGGLFLPGGAQVQVPGAEGAGGGASGAVRGPAGGPGRQRGQTLAELQQSAAAAQQEPGLGRRKPPAGRVSRATEEGGEPGLPPAPEAEAPPAPDQRGELRRSQRKAAAFLRGSGKRSRSSVLCTSWRTTRGGAL